MEVKVTYMRAKETNNFDIKNWCYCLFKIRKTLYNPQYSWPVDSGEKMEECNHIKATSDYQIYNV